MSEEDQKLIAGPADLDLAGSGRVGSQRFGVAKMAPSWRSKLRHPAANQTRLVMHTAAYWLMLAAREAVPTAHRLTWAEFATIPLRRLKYGARILRDRCTRPPRLRHRVS